MGRRAGELQNIRKLEHGKRSIPKKGRILLLKAKYPRELVFSRNGDMGGTK